MGTVSSSVYSRSLGGDSSVSLPCYFGGRSGSHLWVKIVSGPWGAGNMGDAATW
jgi:hypothetical protein